MKVVDIYDELFELSSCEPVPYFWNSLTCDSGWELLNFSCLTKKQARLCGPQNETTRRTACNAFHLIENFATVPYASFFVITHGGSHYTWGHYQSPPNP